MSRQGLPGKVFQARSHVSVPISPGTVENAVNVPACIPFPHVHPADGGQSTPVRSCPRPIRCRRLMGGIDPEELSVIAAAALLGTIGDIPIARRVLRGLDKMVDNLSILTSCTAGKHPWTCTVKKAPLERKHPWTRTHAWTCTATRTLRPAPAHPQPPSANTPQSARDSSPDLGCDPHPLIFGRLDMWTLGHALRLAPAHALRSAPAHHQPPSTSVRQHAEIRTGFITRSRRCSPTRNTRPRRETPDPGRLRGGNGCARLSSNRWRSATPVGSASVPQSGRTRSRRSRIDLSNRLGGRPASLAIDYRAVSGVVVRG